MLACQFHKVTGIVDRRHTAFDGVLFIEKDYLWWIGETNTGCVKDGVSRRRLVLNPSIMFFINLDITVVLLRNVVPSKGTLKILQIEKH